MGFFDKIKGAFGIETRKAPEIQVIESGEVQAKSHSKPHSLNASADGSMLIDDDESRPLPPSSSQNTPGSSKPFTADYASVHAIMAQAAKEQKDNSMPTQEDPYGKLPTKVDPNAPGLDNKVSKEQAQAAGYSDNISKEVAKSQLPPEQQAYGNILETLEGGAKLEGRGPKKPLEEYGTLPNVDKAKLTETLFQASKENPRQAGLLANKIDDISKGMTIEIRARSEKNDKGEKVKEGPVLDKFQPTKEILGEQLQNPDKAQKFATAMASALKETDLGKQDNIIKGAIKEACKGHKTE